MAIAMPDAVLVAKKERAQDVKKAVQMLQAKDIIQQIFSQKITVLGVGLRA